MTQTTTYQPATISPLLRDYIANEVAYDRANFDLTNDFALIEERIIDSMGILRVVTFIEEEFDITVEPQDLMLENFATIDAISSLVMNKLALN